MRAALQSVGELAANVQLRRLLGAWTAFYTGDFMHFVLVAVFAYSAGGTEAVGVATMLNVLPGGLLGPVLAGLAGSRRPQWWLAAGNGFRALIMAATVVAVLSDGSLSVVLVLVALDSLGSAMVRPLHGALVVRLATTVREIVGGNAATSFALSASALAGPALAGVALPLLGLGAAFAVPGVLFVTGAAMALSVSPPASGAPSDESADRDAGSPRPQATRRWAAIMLGFKAIANSRGAIAVAGLYLLAVFLIGVWYVVSVPVALDGLDLGSESVTWAMAAFGAGGLAGGLASFALFTRPRSVAPYVGALLGWAAVLPLVGLVAAPAPVLVGAALLGAVSATAYAGGPSLLQRAVARDAGPAASASLHSLYLVGIALGAIVTPALVGAVGLSAMLVLVGLAVAVATAVALPWTRLADALSDTDRRRLALLQTTPMLSGLPPAGLERLARGSTSVPVPQGHDVVRQGEPGRRFYVVVDGLADILVDGRRVATLGPGGAFGEVALLRDVPRTATVTARTPLDVLAIERDDFLSVTAGEAAPYGRLGSLVAQRIQTPPFEDRFRPVRSRPEWDDAQLSSMLSGRFAVDEPRREALVELALSAPAYAVDPGTVLIREGDYGEAYFAIMEGEAAVLARGRPVRRLSAGDGFGDREIMEDIPCENTVVAETGMTVIALEREAFGVAARPAAR